MITNCCKGLKVLFIGFMGSAYTLLIDNKVNAWKTSVMLSLQVNSSRYFICFLGCFLCLSTRTHQSKTLHNYLYQKYEQPPMTYGNNAPLTDTVPQKLEILMSILPLQKNI